MTTLQMFRFADLIHLPSWDTNDGLSYCVQNMVEQKKPCWLSNLTAIAGVLSETVSTCVNTSKGHRSFSWGIQFVELIIHTSLLNFTTQPTQLNDTCPVSLAYSKEIEFQRTRGPGLTPIMDKNVILQPVGTHAYSHLSLHGRATAYTIEFEGSKKVPPS